MFRNLNLKCLGVSGRQSEAIELALSYQFKGLDIDLVEFAQQVATSGLPHARRLFDSARIPIGAFRLPYDDKEWGEDDKVYKQLLDELPKLAELAATLGCQRCVATIQPASDLRPYHENFEFQRRRIAAIAEVLKQHGIRLGLEFVSAAAPRRGRAFQFIHTFDALVQLVKMVQTGNVGVAADLWQMHVAGASLADLGNLSVEQIVAVYLSDIPADANLEEAGDDQRLLPGETGVIDSAAALASLAERGYDGPVTIRVGRTAVAAANRDQKVKLVAERLKSLWKQVGLDAPAKVVATA